ncbi:MAG: hypothetical protein ACYC3I_10770 [Gemmataceae bacterium]
MAVLMEERSRVSQSLSTQGLPNADGAGTPRTEKSRFRLLRAWFVQAGEFMLGLVLTFIGLLVRATLAVSLLAVPFIALVGTVFLFALMIEGTGAALRAIGLTP